MTVKTILSTKGGDIISIEPTATLETAVKTLAKHRIGALLVLGPDRRVVGILSERDVVRALGEQGADVLTKPLAQVMTRKVVTCGEAETVGTIMERMTTGKFRHVPVIEQDQVVGIISIGDILTWSGRRSPSSSAEICRGYGMPISEVISEGNVGLMQAVKRFEPEKGFRLATYAMWWIKAAIQEYILRSWSLVKLGTTANQKKLFFNLRKAKGKISALEDGDLRPDQVKIIARRLGVTEQDVVDMNRRLGGDVSLNTPIREEGGSGEWQDWLVDEISDQETRLAESEESDNRRKALGEALTVLNDRERRIFEARRLADDAITLEDLASEFGISRERVRQIEVRAFEKVQKAVKNRVATIEIWAA